MRFEYTPTPNDFKRAIRIYHMSDSRLWIIMGVFGLPQFLCSIFLLVQNGTSAGLYPLLLLILFPLFILYLLVFVPWNVAQTAKRNEKMTAKTTWIVSEEQIIVKNTFADSKITWDMIQKAIEARGYYLFFFQGAKKQFQMLPKNAFMSIDQELNFQKMVQRKIKNYRVLKNL